MSRVVIYRDLLWELYCNNNLTSEMVQFNQLWSWIQDTSVIGIIDQFSFQKTEVLFRKLIGLNWTEVEFQSYVQEIRRTLKLCPISVDIQQRIVTIFNTHDDLRRIELEDRLFVLHLACAMAEKANYIVSCNSKDTFKEICACYSIGFYSPSELVQIIQLDRAVQFKHPINLRSWPEGIYEGSWRPANELRRVTSYRDLNCGGYTQINWEINGNLISMVLILQLLPRSSIQIDIHIQVRPHYQVYLPVGLHLVIFNELGDIWQEIQAKPDDSGIQFEMTASRGDRFGIVVSLGDRSHREDFTV